MNNHKHVSVCLSVCLSVPWSKHHLIFNGQESKKEIEATAVCSKGKCPVIDCVRLLGGGEIYQSQGETDRTQVRAAPACPDFDWWGLDGQALRCVVTVL